MNEQKNNGRGIFYGVIGVATLVVAIIGATFAYFTATAGNNVITGNMASISLSLDVTKMTTADQELGGMIPMSNNMIEPALASSKGVCIDDNNNAVCQIYKITITNDSSAGQFVDGYVALKGGSGAAPTDIALLTDGIDKADGTTGTGAFSYVATAKFDASGVANQGTTMRWAQVFFDDDDDTYSLNGQQSLGAEDDEIASINMLKANMIGGDSAAHNIANIRTNNKIMATISGDGNGDGICSLTSVKDDPTTAEVETNWTGDENCAIDTTNGKDAKGVLVSVPISGNNYNVIGTNYIRTSNHNWTEGAQTYKRNTDITSALVFNHNLMPNTVSNGKNVGEYYIVVWLSETGTDQTAGATLSGEGETAVKNPAALKFFTGNVTFVSAQGSEVSATFSSYTRVESDANRPQGDE